MKWIDSFDFFLFDFDGLLVDTEPFHFAAYVIICRNRGFELNWDFDTFCQFAHTSPTGVKEAIYTEFPTLYIREPSWEVLYKEKCLAYQNLIQNHDIKMMPGAEEILRSVLDSQKRLCIVTHSLREYANKVREKIPILEEIPYWVTRKDYDLAKPAPDAYLKAIELLGKPGDRMVGFEDSKRGIQALKGAHVPAVLISTRDEKIQDESIPIFRTFLDIPETGPFNSSIIEY